MRLLSLIMTALIALPAQSMANGITIITASTPARMAAADIPDDQRLFSSAQMDALILFFFIGFLVCLIVILLSMIPDCLAFKAMKRRFAAKERAARAALEE